MNEAEISLKKVFVRPQLLKIIESAEGLEPWREAIISHPEVIEYCGEQEVRRGAGEEVYLLKKKQMSGYHAELFSYVLYLDLAGGLVKSFAPLKLQEYVSVYLTDAEPHVLLTFNCSGKRVNVAIESAQGRFRIHVSSPELPNLLEVEAALCKEAGFGKVDAGLNRVVSREEVHSVLHEMAQNLKYLPE